MAFIKNSMVLFIIYKVTTFLFNPHVIFFFFFLIESNSLTHSRGKSGIKSSSAPSNTKKEKSPLPEWTGRWPKRGALDGGGRQHGGGRGDGHAVVAVDRHVQTAVVHLTQALRGMLRGEKVEKGDGRVPTSSHVK